MIVHLAVSRRCQLVPCLTRTGRAGTERGYAHIIPTFVSFTASEAALAQRRAPEISRRVKATTGPNLAFAMATLGGAHSQRGAGRGSCQERQP